METSEHGLTTEEAAKRLAQYGENVLAEGKKKSVFAVCDTEMELSLIHI